MLNEQQRLARGQLREARQRSQAAYGYSVWGIIPQENPFPFCPPIHLYALHNLKASRIVYIGQTKRLDRRFVEHLNDAMRGVVNPEKAEWLNELQHSGSP